MSYYVATQLLKEDCLQELILKSQDKSARLNVLQLLGACLNLLFAANDPQSQRQQVYFLGNFFENILSIF